MNEFHILLKKELTDMWRSYKFFWMPLLFISLGMMQPLTSYYLADLLEEFGGLPENAIIEFPIPSATQVFTETFSQFSQIGVLIIALSLMGMFANERNKGIAQMILTKPVSYRNYFLSKWTAAILLILTSFVMGVASALYYIHLLFEPLASKSVLVSSSYYFLWLIFVLTVVLFFSCILKKTAAVGAAGILIVLTLTVLPSIFKEPLKWTPGNLQSFAQKAIQGDSLYGTFPLVTVTLFLIVGMGAAAVYYMKKTEWLK
ncbi:ABC transporter permease [Jeotgalibacillus campisalis]|uniref:ABC transporter permease n=1 Tax=Jeotgalibacillus campisalis TaxID=220754 RepID=A0A0C2W9E2_9BACL|nr:ABC transporter permease subunit [Jeotgalibacillus campisalis]KIL53211.1 hypothetical protein KR50_05400 [Jeotgalibacillus campisalis]